MDHDRILILSAFEPLSITFMLLFSILLLSILYNNKSIWTWIARSVTVLLILCSVTTLWLVYRGTITTASLEQFDMLGTVPVHVIGTLTVLIMTYISTVALDTATQKMVERNGKQVIDDHRREVIFRTLQLTMYIFVSIGILNYWDVNIRNILIGAGALAAIVGLSARQTLGSALSGVVLLFSRPFKVGDWIKINDVEGVVRRITIVNTIIQTPSDEQVVVPNDLVGEAIVRNRNKTDKLRLSVTVQVAYEEDMDEVLSSVENSVSQCKMVSNVPEPKSHVESFDDSAITIKSFFWINDPTPRRKMVAVADTNKNVKETLDENGIEIPYPKRSVDVQESDICFSQSANSDEEDSKHRPVIEE